MDQGDSDIQRTANADENSDNNPMPENGTNDIDKESTNELDEDSDVELEGTLVFSVGCCHKIVSPNKICLKEFINQTLEMDTNKCILKFVLFFRKI